MTENEMAGCHHWVDGHEFEQAPGVVEGQGSLACCSPWGFKQSDMTEWLNWTDALQGNRQEGKSRMCCHLADDCLLTQAAWCLFFFFFFKASGNHINLFVTDKGFLLSLPSAGLTYFFSPNAILWKVFICEAAEPKPIAHHSTGWEMESHRGIS